MALLDLPNVPPELRAVQPYLQRADELKDKEPIIAYWCAYYAAQIGISHKSKEIAARELLFALLAKLEHMKADIGPSDAMDQETVSSAYVENFALKVFSLADNEDRHSQVSRSTAKKFLAAANFLEVLKIFPQSSVSDSNDEKIRYAKWKAADIAKAFREGRSPAPGPAPGTAGPQESVAESTPDTTIDASVGAASSEPPSNPPTSSSPPSHIDLPFTPPRKPKTPMDISGSLSVMGQWGEKDPTSPGAWSTVATPGTANPTPSSQFGQYDPIEHGSPSINAKRRMELKQNTGKDSNETDGSPQGSLKYQSNGNANAEALGLPADGSKSVRWTPSVTGGLSSTDGSPPNSPEYEGFPQDPSQSGLNPGFAPPPNQGQWNTFTAPPAPSGSHIYAPPTSSQMFAPSIYATNPNVHPLPVPSAPQIYSKTPSPPQILVVPKSQTTAPEFELTPGIISNAQKHCRFAISSLDYEDLEQARQELKTALSILGG